MQVIQSHIVPGRGHHATCAEQLHGACFQNDHVGVFHYVVDCLNLMDI